MPKSDRGGRGRSGLIVAGDAFIQVLVDRQKNWRERILRLLRCARNEHLIALKINHHADGPLPNCAALLIIGIRYNLQRWNEINLVI